MHHIETLNQNRTILPAKHQRLIPVLRSSEKQLTVLTQRNKIRVQSFSSYKFEYFRQRYKKSDIKNKHA